MAKIDEARASWRGCVAHALPRREAMPGLFGWIGLDRDSVDDASDTSALLTEMARRMSHTGDEVVDTWTDPARGFAIARIAPRHLRPVPWPAPAGETPANRAFVEGFFHGDEGHVDDRVRDLAHRGHTALASLRGSFTVARFQPEHRRLLLAVDRRASRPLAFTVARGRLYFAPEVKALLCAPGFDKTVDDAAIGIFLGAGYLLAHQTLFASTRRLAGGEALHAEPGRRSVEPYHRYRVTARGDGTRARDLEHEMFEIVRGAVERNLGDPRRAVVFLSGGVDSRVIAEAAQMAARRQGEHIRTITWASPSPKPGSDLEIARRVADALGTRHRTVVRKVTAWGARLAEVTYLLDGLSDIPAYHAYEYAVMRDLAGAGAHLVVRGDECFGWQGPVGSLEEAWLTLNLRSLGPLHLLDRAVRREVYPRWCEASMEALAEATRPVAGAHPDDAKDQLYFRHRLQSYLGSAAYLKQVALDHRAPLIDEAVLDLNARVPARLRCDKRLFCQAAARGAPELWRIPFAGSGNLEDWEALLTDDSPVRTHVELELADTASGIWSLFDRQGLRAILPPLGAPPSRSAGARVERSVKTVARAALRFCPSVERRIVVSRHRAIIRMEQVLLRAMVLKSWHDLFVTGDGSRKALHARIGSTAPSTRAA
ncbi:Asparagine synthetase [Minicystis rosea]|nr:Asparagine synthetase [Minicystis rosea]